MDCQTVAPAASAVPISGIASVEAHDVPLLAVAADLFRAYQRELGVDLGFQRFEAELDGLPGLYAPPKGALLLAFSGGEAVGCCGVRPLGQGACELKRLWVHPGHRKRGFGQMLIGEAIDAARRAGHDRMVLDTLPHLSAALSLYTRWGFSSVPHYAPAELPGTMWLGRPISQP